MQAFIDFFTGALNDFAWLYMFLPCVMVGGILLGRGQDAHFLHAVMDELRASSRKSCLPGWLDNSCS